MSTKIGLIVGTRRIRLRNRMMARGLSRWLGVKVEPGGKLRAAKE